MSVQMLGQQPRRNTGPHQYSARIVGTQGDYLQGMLGNPSDDFKYQVQVLDQAQQKSWVVAKTYEEFRRLDMQVRCSISGGAVVPQLPPHSGFFRKTFSKTFQRERQEGCDNFIQAVVNADPTGQNFAIKSFIGTAYPAQLQPAYAPPTYQPAQAQPVYAQSTPSAQAVPLRTSQPIQLGPQGYAQWNAQCKNEYLGEAEPTPAVAVVQAQPTPAAAVVQAQPTPAVAVVQAQPTLAQPQAVPAVAQAVPAVVQAGTTPAYAAAVAVQAQTAPVQAQALGPNGYAQWNAQCKNEFLGKAEPTPAAVVVQAQPSPAAVVQATPAVALVQAQPTPAVAVVQAQPSPAAQVVQAQPTPAAVAVQAQPTPAVAVVQAQAPAVAQAQAVPAVVQAVPTVVQAGTTPAYTTPMAAQAQTAPVQAQVLRVRTSSGSWNAPSYTTPAAAQAQAAPVQAEVLRVRTSSGSVKMPVQAPVQALAAPQVAPVQAQVVPAQVGFAQVSTSAYPSVPAPVNIPTFSAQAAPAVPLQAQAIPVQAQAMPVQAQPVQAVPAQPNRISLAPYDPFADAQAAMPAQTMPVQVGVVDPFAATPAMAPVDPFAATPAMAPQVPAVPAAAPTATGMSASLDALGFASIAGCTVHDMSFFIRRLVLASSWTIVDDSGLMELAQRTCSGKHDDAGFAILRAELDKAAQTPGSWLKSNQ